MPARLRANLATLLRRAGADMLRDGAGLAGGCLVVAGVTMIHEPSGYIVAGLMLMSGAFASARAAR